MRKIINIEDCLELMNGLLIEEEFTPAIEIADKDKKLLLSIAQATFKGKALSDRQYDVCLLYTSPSPRDRTRSRMPSSA